MSHLHRGERTPHHPATAAMLEHFAFDHLPPELQGVSRPVGELAHLMAETLPTGRRSPPGSGSCSRRRTVCTRSRGQLDATLGGSSYLTVLGGHTDQQIVERFAAHYGLPLTSADLAGHTPEEQQVLLAAAMRDHGMLAAGAGHFETLFAVYRSNIAACQEYVLGFRPEFCDYDVLLVRTDEEPATAGPDRALGWRTLFGDRVTQVWLPGDHYSVMKPPIVGRLVPFIDKALNDVT